MDMCWILAEGQGDVIQHLVDVGALLGTDAAVGRGMAAFLSGGELWF
jgi:hypothetical protein